MGKGGAPRRHPAIQWEARDAPTFRVVAPCGHCGRRLYFRYSISPDRALIVEDEARMGAAVLRCVGCGEEPMRCGCVPIKDL